jgi:hypothetical protein
MTEGSEKLINSKQFGALIKAADQAKTKVASVNGEIGERIKHAVDNANLHPGAFKLILKLYRMDEEKRDAFLRSFDAYRDMAGELNLFEEHVGDIDDLARKAAAEEEERQGAEDASIGEENARLVMEGIKPLAGDDAEFDDATSSRPSRRKQHGGVGDAEGKYRIH